MADLARVTVTWEGWTGAPGVNVLHFSPGSTSWSDSTAEDLIGEVNGLYSAISGYWQDGITATVDTTLPIIDSATGTLQAVYSGGDPLPPNDGSGSGDQVSRATMMLLQLRTADIVRGRQLRGRIFIGPISVDVMDSLGQIDVSVDPVVTDAFEAITSGLGPRLCVWSRPKASPATAGSYGDVTSVSVWRQPAVLRSRRD